MKTFAKTLAAALCLGSLAFAAQANTGKDTSNHGTTLPTNPIGNFKACNSDGTCASPNGPSANGFLKLFGHGGASTDYKSCNSDGSCASPNGPSANGFLKLFGHGGASTEFKTCNSDTSCASPNGPSANGFLKLFGHGGASTDYKACNSDGSCAAANGPSMNGWVGERSRARVAIKAGTTLDAGLHR